MSKELWVALPVGEVVTAAGIVAEARRLGFDLDVPAGIMFDELAGFQPGSLDGEPTGADIQLFDRYDVPDMAEAFGERAHVMGRIATFSWDGGMIAGAFCFVVAAALIAGHDGVCFDPQEDEIMPLERLVEVAHGLLTEAGGASAG